MLVKISSLLPPLFIVVLLARWSGRSSDCFNTLNNELFHWMIDDGVDLLFCIFLVLKNA